MAKVDYFLKLIGAHSGVVKGESHDAKHKDEIEVLAWSWEEKHPYTAIGSGTSGAGTGRVQCEPFRMKLRTSVASPKLLLACAEGEHFKSATLTCRKAGKEQQEYLVFTFTMGYLISYRVSSDETQVEPFDELALGFGKIEMVYKPQNPDGTLGGGVMGSHDWSHNAR